MIKQPLTRVRHATRSRKGEKGVNSNELSLRPLGREGAGDDGVQAARSCNHLTVTQPQPSQNHEAIRPRDCHPLFLCL